MIEAKVYKLKEIRHHIFSPTFQAEKFTLAHFFQLCSKILRKKSLKIRKTRNFKKNLAPKLRKWGCISVTVEKSDPTQKSTQYFSKKAIFFAKNSPTYKKWHVSVKNTHIFPSENKILSPPLSRNFIWL